MNAWGTEYEGKEEEEPGMDHTLRMKDGMSGPETPETGGAPKDVEAPRADLPDWLAKELFKIFV